jgi:hypothetical protein
VCGDWLVFLELLSLGRGEASGNWLTFLSSNVFWYLPSLYAFSSLLFSFFLLYPFPCLAQLSFIFVIEQIVLGKWYLDIY